MATDVLSGMHTYNVVLATILLLPAVANAQLTTSTTEVVLHDKTLARVESGQLQVPESRTRPSGRKVTIPFYRLKSEAAAQAAPIFLLAGGPGSSWLEQFEAEETNREARFYQTIADVVLFDQRGGGRATPAMTCGDSAPLPPSDAPLDMAKVSQVLRNLLVQCRDRWQAQGVDLAAYNTVESAADVNDLRLALGYRKITLIGGSYGSHLALQFMRQFPDAVDRVVIFGVEGPDHTWDDPAGALHTLERIAAATEQSPEFRDRVPEGGLLKTLERVIERLDVEPQMVTVATGTTNQRVLVDGARMRRMVRANAGRKSACLALAGDDSGNGPRRLHQCCATSGRPGCAEAARSDAFLHGLCVRREPCAQDPVENGSGAQAPRRREFRVRSGLRGVAIRRSRTCVS